MGYEERIPQKDFHKAIETKIKAMLPGNCSQSRLKDGTYKLTSKWRNGELKRMDLDGDQVNVPGAKGLWDYILHKTGNYRHKFYGDWELLITMRDGEVREVEVFMRKYLIRKKDEDSFNKFPERK
jgi:hypothetical protein